MDLSSAQRKVDLLQALEEAIIRWRQKYKRELIEGPTRRNKVKEIRHEDFMITNRPFFTAINREDPFYANTFRSIEYNALKYNISSKIVIMRVSGYRLGQDFVRQGLISSLDDAPLVLAMYKIGLLDIVNESLNKMRLNIYECISCYGLPNLGRTMCDFEAGVIQGILTELYGSNVVKEKYCWGTGYSFCGFEAYFE